MTDLILDIQNLTFLDWSARKMSPGTPGCFLKAYEGPEETRIYYKLSNYDSYRGIYGHECVNELIASRLLDCLGISHVQYRLVHARLHIDDKDYVTWISASDNFRNVTEEKLAFDTYYDMKKQKNESPLNFAIRLGWERYIYRMLCVDYLIGNRDRHGGNLEVLRDVVTGTVRLAPLFDQGLSFVFSTYGDVREIEAFDVMRDIQANNFIGSRSLEYNLSLIPLDYDLVIQPLQEDDKEYVLQGLDAILDKVHLDKIWEMIWRRWQRFETLRHQK